MGKPFLITQNQNSMKKLRSKVVKALKREFTFECTISARMNQVILDVKNIDFEQHLGQLIQQTQQIIDKYFPQREEHLCLVIRQIDGNHQNTFKIWKSVN
jgi:ABC-type microcin C transport system permease subunit YejB